MSKTAKTAVPTNSTTTSSKISSSTTKISCTNYAVPDPRPFFEREPIQLNLPRRLNIIDEDLFKRLRSLRLLVLATARDVERKVDNFRKHIEPIVDLFDSTSRILICESDSSDKTVAKLYQWPRAQVYQYGNLRKSYPLRPERIAFCRNKLVNLTYQLPSDYILHVDLDLFATDIPAFLSNFYYHTDDWSVMTATSRAGYYDLWALRTLSDSVLNFDVWRRVRYLERSNPRYCRRSIFSEIIGNHQKHIPAERGLVEVRSAFNGAGLYKSNVTRECLYSGKGTVCEHVSFHLCIRDKHQGRIFINPEFILDSAN